MKAAIMRQRQLIVDELPDPVPGAGEVLVKTLACGICGSDLHMLHHCEVILPVLKRAGIPNSFDPGRDVVFGHEYCAEVLDYGPGTERNFKPGTRICAMPLVIQPDRIENIGYSNLYPGGYGERMVLPESFLIPVPGDLPAELAALTEPLAVAVHAVNHAHLQGNEAPIVLGCGPIGLAVIVALKARGAGPVIAADFSPHRRALAEKLGADIVVDPAQQSPYLSWLEMAAPPGFDPKSPEAFFGVGPQPKPCVVFECVGVPGLIAQVISSAPPRSRVVVVGICMQPDTIEPVVAAAKELNIQFSFGYTAEEFTCTLFDLADEKLRAGDMITGRTGVEGIPKAFEDLSRPEHHAKIMIHFD